jgi:large subunit ribosomal protein L5
MPSALKAKYKDSIRAELQQEFGIDNVMQLPEIEKVVVNMGVGDAIGDARLLDVAMEQLALITGQQPCIRLAKKSISNFKLREGAKIACMSSWTGCSTLPCPESATSAGFPRKLSTSSVITRWASRSRPSFPKWIKIRSTVPAV